MPIIGILSRNVKRYTFGRRSIAVGTVLAREKNKNYYQVLGVEYNATRSEIKKAYYKLARKYHPDANTENPKAAKIFEEVSEAYGILRDEAKRHEYDTDTNWDAATNESDFMKDSTDKYDAIFNEYSTVGRNPQKDWMVGADFNFTQSDNIPKSAQVLTMKVSFQEAARGGSRRIRVRLRDECPVCEGSGADVNAPHSYVFTCPRCGGTGKEHIKAGPLSTKSDCMKCNGSGSFATQICNYCIGRGWNVQKKILTCAIPEGVQDTEIVRLNIGEQHVFIKYEVMPDRIFSRDGVDVMQNVTVPVSKLLLGGQIKLYSLTENQFLRMTLPECTAPNSLLRIKGQGIRDTITNEYGDMLVKVLLETPNTLTARQRQAMLTFADDDDYSGGVHGSLRTGEWTQRITDE